MQTVGFALSNYVPEASRSYEIKLVISLGRVNSALFTFFALITAAAALTGFIFSDERIQQHDNEFVTHYRTKLGTRRVDISYRRRSLMTRCVTDIHAAAVGVCARVHRSE